MIENDFRCLIIEAFKSHLDSQENNLRDKINKRKKKFMRKRQYCQRQMEKGSMFREREREIY